MEHLIIDTDVGFDCDDAGALAIANQLKNEGETEILAVTHSVNRKIGGDAIQAVNDDYGNKDIPIGGAQRYAINVDHFYEEFYANFHYTENFPGWTEKPTFYKILNTLNLDEYKVSEYESAEKVIIDALCRSEDNSVTFVCIGQANNIADVLNCNRALFFRKVKRVVIMCGNFVDYDKEYLLGDMYWKGEFNVLLDIRSMQRLFTEKNLPVFVLDFNQGFDVLSSEGLQKQTNNPVRKAYLAHGNGIDLNMLSWDIKAVMFACGKFSDLYSVSAKGVVTVDDNGKTSFVSGGGEHCLIYGKESKDKISCLINRRLAIC